MNFFVREILPTLMAALVAIGLFDWLRSSVVNVRARVRSGTESGQRMARLTETDKSVLVLAKTRDELVEDIERLRSQLRDCEERLDAERRAREQDRAAYQRQIEHLTEDLRRVRNRVDVLLAEVDRMRSAVTTDEGTS